VQLVVLLVILHPLILLELIHVFNVNKDVIPHHVLLLAFQQPPAHNVKINGF